MALARYCTLFLEHGVPELVEELAEYKRQQEKNLEVKINSVSKDAPVVLNEDGEVVVED